MVLRLYIQNYALIKHLDIRLSSGFTAITGETGSGKSILIGALGLALGERADTHVLFEKDIKCVVEAEFDLKKMDLKSFFKQHDLDYHPTTVLRREISPSGRSRAFVNDTPVQLAVMKSLAEHLVDLHSQHQTLLLADEDFQLSLLDIFAKPGKALHDYQEAYQSYRLKQDELRKTKAFIRNNQIDKDYLRFQIDELEALELTPGRDTSIAEELGLLEHAEEIRSVLHSTTGQLNADKGLLNQLNSLSHQLDGISGHTKGLEELAGRLNSLRLELDDIRLSIEEVESQVEIDPERHELLSEQMDTIQRLFNKHKVQDMDGLISIRSDIDRKLLMADESHRKLELIQEALLKLEQNLNVHAEKLTDLRQKAVAPFVSGISKQFKHLSLVNAKINIETEQSPDYHLFGKDQVNVLFNANKGGQLESLSKVASGGELSRLMLILKSELAKSRHLPTLIFDEIDTGVSGEIASQMAEKLRSMSKGRQVISITHLPQVAARANNHFRISKSDTKERSITDVQALDEDGRLLELAKMLSGSRISEASMDNARELLKN